MIPAFDERGVLPEGIHEATLEEVVDRFGKNIYRKELIKKLIKLIDGLRSIGCHTIFLDGSFTTNKSLPKDMDICWDNKTRDLKYVLENFPVLYASKETQQREYSSDIFPAFEYESDSQKLFLEYFQFDTETRQPKGIIKILI